jgi:hypothetical protein
MSNLKKVFAEYTALELQIEGKNAEISKLLAGLTLDELNTLCNWGAERRNKIYAEEQRKKIGPQIPVRQIPARVRYDDGVCYTAKEVLQLPLRRVLADEIDWTT